MPKRRNPSAEKKDKAEAKKARAGDSDPPNGHVAGAKAKQAVAVAASAAVGAEVASSSALPAAGDRPIDAVSSPPTPMSKKPSSASAKSNGRSGVVGNGSGNSFLKSVRSKQGDASQNQNGGGTKEPASADTVTAATTKSASPSDSGTASSSAAADEQLPVVPFPRLPPLQNNNESSSRRRNRSPLALLTLPLATLLLFVLNMAAAAYVGRQRSRHDLIRLRCDAESERLREELAASRDENNALRERMDALERVRGERERTMSADEDDRDDGEVFDGAGGGDGDVLTMEERRDWLERFHKMEAEGRAVLSEFNENLLEFEA